MKQMMQMPRNTPRAIICPVHPGRSRSWNEGNPKIGFTTFVRICERIHHVGPGLQRRSHFVANHWRWSALALCSGKFRFFPRLSSLWRAGARRAFERGIRFLHAFELAERSGALWSPGNGSSRDPQFGRIACKITRTLLLCCVVWQSACAVSKQLSRDKAREKIQALGLIQLADKDIQIKQIVQSGDDQAVAEADLSMAFRLSRAKDGDWQVNALRLGDRNWLDIKAFISALNDVRLRETRENLTKLLNGMKLFKEKNGEYPQARNIVELTDILVPNFMAEMIRYDGWNREFVVSFTSPDSFELISLGADGIRGTADDTVVAP
jgi:hypothetical protein